MERARKVESKNLPMEGFNGNGLKGLESVLVGNRASRGGDRVESDDEDLQDDHLDKKKKTKQERNAAASGQL